MTLDVHILAESIRTSPTAESWIRMLTGLQTQPKSSEKMHKLEIVIDALIRTKRKTHVDLALTLQYELVNEMGTKQCNQPIDVRLRLQLLRLLIATGDMKEAKIQYIMLNGLTQRLGLERDKLRSIVDRFPALLK